MRSAALQGLMAQVHGQNTKLTNKRSMADGTGYGLAAADRTADSFALTAQ